MTCGGMRESIFDGWLNHRVTRGRGMPRPYGGRPFAFCRGDIHAARRLHAAIVCHRATNGRPYNFLVTFVGAEHEGGTPAVGEFPAPTTHAFVGAAFMPPSSYSPRLSGRILRCTQDDMCENAAYCNHPGVQGPQPLVGEGVRESREPRGNLNVPPGSLALAERTARTRH